MKTLPQLNDLWKKTGKKPPALENRPTLFPQLVLLLSMYREIASTEREYKETGPEPLQLRSVNDYWKMFEIDKSVSFAEFWGKIRLIDYLWLKQVTADQERRRAATPKAPKPARKR